MFPLLGPSNNPLSPNFSLSIFILSLLFHNVILFGPGYQIRILSLTIESKAITKHLESKNTGFPSIDVIHTWKDCSKPIFLQNEYYHPHSSFNIRGGLGKWKVNFCGMHNSWRNLISPHIPLRVEEMWLLSSLKPGKGETKRITKTNWGYPNYLFSCKSVNHEYLSSKLIRAWCFWDMETGTRKNHAKRKKW